MGTIKTYVKRNWFWIVAGLILTAVSVKMAHDQRGYTAYGGEWLTLPLILMIAEITRKFEELLLFLFDKSDYQHIRMNGESCMCEICRSTPCLSRCPNAAEPVPVYECSRCGYGIFEGDKYYDSPEGYICEDCIEDMTVDEFMNLTGDKFSTAKKEE